MMSDVPSSGATSASKVKTQTAMVRTHFRVFEYDNGKSVFLGKSTCMVKAIEIAKSKKAIRKVVKYARDLPSIGESIWCTTHGFIGDALSDGEHACAMDMIDEDNE